MGDSPFVIVTCDRCSDTRLAMPDEAATSGCPMCGSWSRTWEHEGHANSIRHFDEPNPFDAETFASTIFPRPWSPDRA